MAKATTKHKTHKGMRKRVTVSAGNKIRYKKSFAGHLMSGKSGRRKQRLRRASLVKGGFVDNVLRALGLA